MLDRFSELKEKLRELFDRTSDDAIALLITESNTETVAAQPMPDWMSATQLARYWQLVDVEGEPATAAIMKWTKRPESEHPLPHACMGDLLRFHREDVDSWAREEAERRRSQ